MILGTITLGWKLGIGVTKEGPTEGPTHLANLEAS